MVRTFTNAGKCVILSITLQVVSDPLSEKGDEALLNILNIPNRFLSNRFKADLQKYADSNGLKLYQALQHMPITIPYEKRGVEDFIRKLEPLMKMADQVSPA